MVFSGMGRAPAVALAWMNWVLGRQLEVGGTYTGRYLYTSAYAASMSGYNSVRLAIWQSVRCQIVDSVVALHQMPTKVV